MVEDLKRYFSELSDDIKNIKKDNISIFIKKRAKLLISLIIVLSMFLGFGIGNINKTKEHLLVKLEVALKEGKPSKLKSIVKFNGKRVSINDIKPLVDYYFKDTSRVNSLINKLRNLGESDDFKFVEEDRLFGSKCYLDIKGYSLKIDSDFENSKFTLDGKNYINSGETKENLIPGIYTVKGILESEFGNIESSKEIVIMKNEEIDMDFNAVMLNISSEFHDAELFINGEATGILVKDAKNIGPFPSNGEVKVHIEKEFPWGRVKGEDVEVRDIPNLTLNIKMQNEIMTSEINNVVSEFYKSVFLALNNEDKSLINGGTESVINKIYNILEKKYFVLKNTYDIKEIDIIDDKSQYRYENGVYSATIVVDVDYTVSKSFLGLNKKDNNKMFFTKIMYNGESWTVEDVENFSL